MYYYLQILIYTQNTNICNESISYLFSQLNATLYLEHRVMAPQVSLIIMPIILIIVITVMEVLQLQQHNMHITRMVLHLQSPIKTTEEKSLYLIIPAPLHIGKLLSNFFSPDQIHVQQPQLVEVSYICHRCYFYSKHLGCSKQNPKKTLWLIIIWVVTMS